MSGKKTTRGDLVQLAEADLAHARGGLAGRGGLDQPGLQIPPRGIRPKPGGPTRYIGETEKNLD